MILKIVFTRTSHHFCFKKFRHWACDSQIIVRWQFFYHNIIRKCVAVVCCSSVLQWCFWNDFWCVSDDLLCVKRLFFPNDFPRNGVFVFDDSFSEWFCEEWCFWNDFLCVSDDSLCVKSLFFRMILRILVFLKWLLVCVRRLVVC